MGNNISSSNIAGPCNLKCAFSFQYPNSSCIATNQPDAISLSYDQSNVPPVTYNGDKYQVSQVLLSPSSTLFYNENRSIAQISIIHNSPSGGNTLIIIIPIVESNSITKASTILSEIISSVSSQAPKQNEKTTINLTNYSLNHFVPNKPYYKYNNGNSGSEEIIAYGLDNAIPLDKSSLNKLTFLIPPGVQPIYNATEASQYAPLYYNKDGPGSQATSDIYIDCQPVDESEETVQVSVNKLGSANYDVGENSKEWFNSLIHNVIFQCVMVAIFLFFLLYLLRMGVKQFTLPV